MKKTLIYSLFIFFLIGFSCSEEGDFIVESSNIAISMEEEGGDIKIVWNKPRMDSLLGYVLIRTTEEREIGYYIDIANYYTSQGRIGIWHNGVIAYINAEEAREYRDEFGPIESKYYYKLFAYSSNGQFVLSNTISYFKDGIATLDFIPDAALYSPSQDRIVLSMDESLFVFDCASNKIVAEATNRFYYSDRFCIGNNGFGDEIYLASGAGKLHIFDFDLNVLHSVNINDQFIFDVATDNKGFIFVKGTYEYDYFIYTIDRSNLSVREPYVGKYEWAELACFEESNELIEIGDARIYAHSYDTDGGLFYNDKYMDVPYSWKTEKFPDGTKLLLGNGGYIIDSSLESYIQLNPNYQYYSDFAISTHYIFASRQSERQIDKFNMDYEQVETLESLLYPRFICASEDNLYVIGTLSSYYPSKWGIQVIPLSK